MNIFLLTTGGTEVGWSRHNDEGFFRDYEAEADRLIKSAEPYGFECRKFGNEFFFSRPYYKTHKSVMDKVSFGFTYKAIELQETMENEMSFGDIAIVVDSNHLVINPDPVIGIINQYDCWIYDHIWVRYPNRDWTRRDTFVNMGCDEPQYWASLQMHCNLIGFKKTPKTVDFVREYFEDCLTYNIMFGENKYPNFDSFRVHRHDQSIFSILRQKYRLPYLNRTNTMWAEDLIPERGWINPKSPVDNSHRKEEDSKENK